MSETVIEIIRKYSQLQSDRYGHETDWNDIRNLVRPVSLGINRTTGKYVYVRTEAMYDGTAPEALEELASALHSYLSNPTERWFELSVDSDHEANMDPDILLWLETVADIIYDSYCREHVMLNQSLHEAYMDVGAFGNGCINQEWSWRNNDILFSAKPVADCFIQENSEGIVDTMYRRVKWSLRQVKQEFPGLPPRLSKETNEEKDFEILHAIFPRTDAIPGNPGENSKAFASVWLCVTTKELLKVGGYDQFPYHWPRWAKLAGEVYGRGPAKKCLPDIKMLNSMEKTLLKAGQKAVDPPIVVDNEGFLLPLRTSPGALIFKEPGTEHPEPLIFSGNLPWGLEQANQKREFIRNCFYADWIRMEKANKEMTAYEVADRREEKLRLLAPMLGRLVSELHGPMIKRTYALLNDHGRIPLAPQQLQGKRVKIGYTSPASRAQTGVKALQMSRFIQELIPLVQLAPDILDVVDIDRYAQELALARGTPRIILRSPEAVTAIRQSRQQQQQMAQMAQVAEPVTKSIKNLADARDKGLDISQLTGAQL